MQESEIKKFRTIVSEVSSCVGIPIYMFYCSVLNESNMQIKEQENKSTKKRKLPLEKIVNFYIIDEYCSWFWL